MDCVMGGKSEDERHEVIKKIMSDGMVRMPMEKSELDLIHIMCDHVIPEENTEGGDVGTV